MCLSQGLLGADHIAQGLHGYICGGKFIGAPLELAREQGSVA